MDWLEAALLGLVQGLTEFLPVSSSGHLELMRVLLGRDDGGEQGLLLMILLHGATALATLVYFRQDILKILQGSIRGDASSWNFVISIAVSMIPAVAVGLGFEEQFEELFDGRTSFIGMMLLMTAVLLSLPYLLPSQPGKVNPWRGLGVGIAQAAAILPGISRSGATISAALILGMDKQQAARFSFLMVIPLILGKIAHLLVTESSAIMVDIDGPMILSILVAFLSALLACHWMLVIVRRAKLYYFSFYCLVVGLWLIFY